MLLLPNLHLFAGQYQGSAVQTPAGGVVTTIEGQGTAGGSGSTLQVNRGVTDQNGALVSGSSNTYNVPNGQGIPF